MSTQPIAFPATAETRICLVSDPADPVASATAARWARQTLSDAISHSGISAKQYSSLREAPRSDLCVVIAGSKTSLALAALRAAAVSVPSEPESLAIVHSTQESKPILLVCGADARGLMYALLELADRIRHGENP